MRTLGDPDRLPRRSVGGRRRYLQKKVAQDMRQPRKVEKFASVARTEASLSSPSIQTGNIGVHVVNPCLLGVTSVMRAGGAGAGGPYQ